MKRPISPHLQIYNIFSKEMTSGISILHRIAGVGLLVGLVYILAWLFCLSLSEVAYDHFIIFMKSWFGMLSLYGLLACFIFYILTEIRFLIFATGYGLEKKQVKYSGWFVVILFAIIFALGVLRVQGYLHVA